MILRIILLFLALAPFSSPLQASVWNNVASYFKGQTRSEPPSIRVLLVHNIEGANLQVRGRYSLYDPHMNSYISSRFAGKSRYIQAAADGLKWGESFPGLYQLKIEPADRFMEVSIDDHDYKGSIYIYDVGGKISIVNKISVEDYVSSILANYRDQQFEPEALAALVIATRTNAYFQSVNPKTTYWAVDGQKVGFQGVVSGNSAIEQAIKQTRFMIMSKTGVYERVATPFAAQFGDLQTGQSTKDVEVSKISLEEANAMAQKGEHAAQILAKAFPGSTIMLMQYPQ